MKLQLFFTSALYVLLGGLLFHFLIGISPEIIFNDLKNTGFQLAGYVCQIVAFFCLRLVYYAVKNRQVIERNRQATILLRKIFSGNLTETEQQDYARFRRTGVLTFNSKGVLRLSDQAVNDLFR